MKITDVTTHLLTVHWADDPWFPSFLNTTAVIRITTDAGIDGLGEATLGYFAPEGVPPIVDFFKPALIGRDPMRLSRLARDLFDEAVFWARSGAGRSVISGIEIALWDIVGKALGVPVYQLLGGAVRDRIRVYASGGPSLWPAEENVKKVGHYADLGFRAVKLSSHFYEFGGSATDSLRRIKEVHIPHAELIDKIAANFEGLRRHFGSDVELTADGHQGGVPDPIPETEAMQIAEALAPCRLHFFEEPLSYTDLDGYARLAARSPVPVAGGESLSGLDQFEVFLSRGAFHIIQPDIGFAGGIQETLRIIHAAEARNVRTALHTGAAMGPGLAAAWHLAAAVQSVDWLEWVIAGRSAQDAMLLDPLEPVEGFVGLPSSPGLGVHLTDETLAKHRFVPGTGERT